jgi:hypothetical protein
MRFPGEIWEGKQFTKPDPRIPIATRIKKSPARRYKMLNLGHAPRGDTRALLPEELRREQEIAGAVKFRLTTTFAVQFRVNGFNSEV